MGTKKIIKLKSKTKKYTTDNGSRCSGYGVYPDGRKCKGCSDCEGKKITIKGVREAFSRNHLMLTLKSKKSKTKPKK